MNLTVGLQLPQVEEEEARLVVVVGRALNASLYFLPRTNRVIEFSFSRTMQVFTAATPRVHILSPHVEQ